MNFSRSVCQLVPHTRLKSILRTENQWILDQPIWPSSPLFALFCPQVQEKLKQYQGQPFTMQTMAVIKNLIEGW